MIRQWVLPPLIVLAFVGMVLAVRAETISDLFERVQHSRSW